MLTIDTYLEVKSKICPWQNQIHEFRPAMSPMTSYEYIGFDNALASEKGDTSQDIFGLSSEPQRSLFDAAGVDPNHSPYHSSDHTVTHGVTTEEDTKLEAFVTISGAHPPPPSDPARETGGPAVCLRAGLFMKRAEAKSSH